MMSTSLACQQRWLIRWGSPVFFLLWSYSVENDHWRASAQDLKFVPQASPTTQATKGIDRQKKKKVVPSKVLKNEQNNASSKQSQVPLKASQRLKPKRPSGFLNNFVHPMPRPPAENTGRLSDTLVATIPGSLLHGLGHWHRGDLDSAKKILLLEGLGILSILGGYTLHTLSEQDTYAKQRGEQWLYHTGGVLLLTSWFTDIIGSFRGDLPRRGLRRIEHSRSISMGYRYRDDPQSQHNHHWVAQLHYATNRLRISGAFNWESKGEVVGLDGSLMGSIYQHDRQWSNFVSQVEVGVRIKRWTWFVDDLTQWLVIPQIEGTIGLNHLSSGLRGYALFHRVGLGWERFSLAPLPQSLPGKSSLLSYPLIMESGLKIHPYSSLVVSFSLIEDNTLDMRPNNQAGLFWGGTILFQQTDQVAININALWGDDWSTWIMLSFSKERER